MDVREYLEIKDRAWESISEIPGVHAVGISTKVVAGSRTTEPAIVVFVDSKKSVDQLGASELIPSMIEGVKTDVVEMQRPRLLEGAQDIFATVDPGGTTLTLTGADPPPEGWVVIAAVTIAPLLPGTAPRHVYKAAYTNGVLRLSKLAQIIADGLSHGLLDASNPVDTAEVHIATTDSDHTAVVSGSVLRIDSVRYADDYLRGGVRIQRGGIRPELGTLGCLATTAPTPRDPAGTVVGVTNQHVISIVKGLTTGLVVKVDDQARTLEMALVRTAAGATVPAAARTLVFVGFFDEQGLVASAFYTTAAGDTLADIAIGVSDAINNAAIPGVSASPNVDNPNKVDVLGPNALLPGCDTLGPSQPDPTIRLHAAVRTTGPVTTAIRFEGESREDYGILVRVNPRAATATFGVFVDATGLSLGEIAQQISSSINALSPSVTGLVSATAVGPEVTIHRAEEVECIVQSDILVGHPTNSFLFPASHAIGKVIDARLDVDAAIIQLRPGLKYKPQIEELGPIDGVEPATLLMQVQKRGFVSRVTSGEIVAMGTTGNIVGDDQFGTSVVFKRVYTNVMVIQSTTTDDAGRGTLLPFVMEGDSGSVVLTTGAGPLKVVGLLFGGSRGTMALATPIEQVTSAFAKHGLSFDLRPGQDPDALQNVPRPVSA